jgi:tRNA G18 (ribose-2'-O)-methylase SpoU
LADYPVDLTDRRLRQIPADRSVPDGLDPLHDLGFTSIALTPDPAATELDAIPLAAGERVALLLGAEEPGLTPATQQRATHRGRIPMHQGIDSLNVATAAAIAMWQVTRARP